MAKDARSLPEEVAELTEAVRELRDREVAAALERLRQEIAALREQQAQACTGHHGCHCGCWHWHVTPTWVYTAGAAQPFYPYTVSVGTSTTNGYVQSWQSTAGAAGNGTCTVTLNN